jgi:O-antigen ligase
MKITDHFQGIPQLNELNAREKTFKLLNLSVPVLMGIFIFLNPFPHTTAIKEICFYGSVIITFTLICLKKVDFSFQSPLTLPFSLFMAWAFIGLFFAIDPENSIHDFQTHLLKYVVFYYIIINYFNSRERLYWLSGVIIVSAAIFSTGQIVYFYGLLGNAFSTKLVTGLSEVAVNWVGIIAVPAVIFSLHQITTANRLNTKIASLICLFPTFVICFLTQARSAVLALLLSVIILFFKNKKFLIACLGIVLILIAMTSIKDRFTEPDRSSVLRFGTYCITYEMIKDHPVMGIGFGMETYGNRKFVDLEAYKKRIPEKYRGNILTDPHSMLFSVAVRTGLIGLALFLYILFVPFRMSWSCIRRKKDDFMNHWGRSVISAFVAILVIGFFEPFFSHVPEVVFYTLLAMMTIAWKLGNIGTDASVESR